MTRGVVVALTALTVLGATASEADGQRFRQRKAPRAHVGVSFIAAEPVGELGAFFDQGFGGQIAVGIPVDDYDDFGATTHLVGCGGRVARCGWHTPTHRQPRKARFDRLRCGTSRERDRPLPDRGQHPGSRRREHLDLPEPK